MSDDPNLQPAEYERDLRQEWMLEALRIFMETRSWPDLAHTFIEEIYEEQTDFWPDLALRKKPNFKGPSPLHFARWTLWDASFGPVDGYRLSEVDLFLFDLDEYRTELLKGCEPATALLREMASGRQQDVNCWEALCHLENAQQETLGRILKEVEQKLIAMTEWDEDELSRHGVEDEARLTRKVLPMYRQWLLELLHPYTSGEFSFATEDTLLAEDTLEILRTDYAERLNRCRLIASEQTADGRLFGNRKLRDQFISYASSNIAEWSPETIGKAEEYAVRGFPRPDTERFPRPDPERLALGIGSLGFNPILRPTGILGLAPDELKALTKFTTETIEPPEDPDMTWTAAAGRGWKWEVAPSQDEWAALKGNDFFFYADQYHATSVEQTETRLWIRPEPRVKYTGCVAFWGDVDIPEGVETDGSKTFPDARFYVDFLYGEEDPPLTGMDWREESLDAYWRFRNVVSKLSGEYVFAFVIDREEARYGTPQSSLFVVRNNKRLFEVQGNYPEGEHDEQQFERIALTTSERTASLIAENCSDDIETVPVDRHGPFRDQYRRTYAMVSAGKPTVRKHPGSVILETNVENWDGAWEADDENISMEGFHNPVTSVLPGWGEENVFDIEEQRRLFQRHKETLKKLEMSLETIQQDVTTAEETVLDTPEFRRVCLDGLIQFGKEIDEHTNRLNDAISASPAGAGKNQTLKDGLAIYRDRVLKLREWISNLPLKPAATMSRGGTTPISSSEAQSSGKEFSVAEQCKALRSIRGTEPEFAVVKGRKGQGVRLKKSRVGGEQFFHGVGLGILRRINAIIAAEGYDHPPITENARMVTYWKSGKSNEAARGNKAIKKAFSEAEGRVEAYLKAQKSAE